MEHPLYIEMPEYVAEYEIIEDSDPGPSRVNSSDGSRIDYKWNVEHTKLLIELYSKYKDKIGTAEIKSTKMLWVKVAQDMRECNIRVTPNNCLNRWRVLERNYRKFKTGTRRTYFEFANEMSEIFGKVKYVDCRSPSLVAKPQAKVVVKKNVTNQTTIEKMRTERQTYNEARLEIEKQKLDQLTRRNDLLEERNKILKEMKCCCQSNVLK